MVILILVGHGGLILEGHPGPYVLNAFLRFDHLCFTDKYRWVSFHINNTKKLESDEYDTSIVWFH